MDIAQSVSWLWDTKTNAPLLSEFPESKDPLPQGSVLSAEELAQLSSTLCTRLTGSATALFDVLALMRWDSAIDDEAIQKSERIRTELGLLNLDVEVYNDSME